MQLRSVAWMVLREQNLDGEAVRGGKFTCLVLYGIAAQPERNLVSLCSRAPFGRRQNASVQRCVFALVTGR